MKRLRQFISILVVVAFVSLGLPVITMETQAQNATPYRYNQRRMKQIVQRIETRADSFSRSLERALDQSRLNGTREEDDINKLVTAFEASTDTLKDRFNEGQSTDADVELVLGRASLLNDVMRNNPLTYRAQQDWRLLKSDLNRLASAYNISRRVDTPYTPPIGNINNSYSDRYSESYMKDLVRRIETRSDTFSRSLERALDQSRLNGTQREDEINKLVTAFEASTDTLRKQFDARRSTDADVELVLGRASLLNDVMRNNALNYRAQQDWRVLKADLDRLAMAYNVSRRVETPYTPPVDYGTNTYNNADARLTGTYRLNLSRSQDPHTVATNVTRNLPARDRQRVYDTVVNRLGPPETLAIERRGTNVTIASTKAPQVTIEADGRERIESYPNNRQSKVTARFYGDQLRIASEGDRINDFYVDFLPANNGRSLQVTRRIYIEGTNQQITVASHYDKTSDIAQLNLNQVGPTYPTNDVVSVDFVVPNGTQIVAVLNEDLTTKTAKDNDRFTMTVNSPSQFAGATLEGYLSNVSRSGRITGRSDMTFNFEQIRLRNGRAYRFAGLLNSVRTPGGETAQVDNEGAVQESDNRTNTTIKRTAIGSAVGAIFGAILGGGKGAVIGATVGAGAGAGSVYVQGSDDLELMHGTEITLTASAPR